MSGITVKRTVSSSRRTQAIFSSDESAATNSVEPRVASDVVGAGFDEQGVLEKVRVFRRLALNLMLNVYALSGVIVGYAATTRY